MAFPRIGGPGVGLDLGIYAGIQGNQISLPAGLGAFIPSGTWQITPGQYTDIQFRDPITNLFRSLSASASITTIGSDGYNWRLVNASGCPVGAFVTNVGSAYTSAPVVTSSAGSSTWTAIVGGAISQTVTVGTAGTGYTYPPMVLIAPPPAGGVPATATCVLSGAGVGTITVVNQGAGYTTAPAVTFVNDIRDTTGAGAKATATLTGAGTITAVLLNDRGTALTAVPTLTFTGGGGSAAAATVVMNFAATGFTVGTAGAAYGNAQPFMVITGGGIVGGTAGAVVNPAISTGLFTPVQANITGVSTAGGAVTATGLVVNNGGSFQSVPTGFVLPGGSGLPTTTGIVTITVGGVTDTSILQAI